MRDLHIKCASGDADQLRFTTNVRGIDNNEVFITIRNRQEESVLWINAHQAKRLAEWINEALGVEAADPEVI